MFADELFIVPAAVRVGRVEERDPELEGAFERRYRLGIVALSVRARHSPAPESDRRYRRTVPSQSPLLHGGGVCSPIILSLSKDRGYRRPATGAICTKFPLAASQRKSADASLPIPR